MTSHSSSRIDLTQSIEFSRSRTELRQVLSVGNREYVTQIQADVRSSRLPHVAWVQAFLRGARQVAPPPRARLRAVDLFCGSGGLTSGLKYGATALGLSIDHLLAADADLQALEVFGANHGPLLKYGDDVQKLVNYQVAASGLEATWSTVPRLIDPHLGTFLDDLDVLVAGPPCQGHSNLNNWTRRNDNRNLLYITTVAFAIATSTKLCIIENVPEVLNDSHDVVRTARALFAKCGYRISDAVLAADDFGVAQRRRRHFLVAVRNPGFDFNLQEVAANLKVKRISVRHAIADLSRSKSNDLYNSVGELSKENIRRIDWLHDNDKDDLPDRLRPDCHKNGHTYPSVYGRMKWAEPAQTITTGFLTPGRGRFVHPSERRTVTPHEAARLQSFSDNYEFSPSAHPATRASFGKVIGDAVPPLLARAVAIAGLCVLESGACV